MIRRSDEKIDLNKFSTVLLWILSILYFYFISVHSSMPAESSTKASEVIVKKAYLVMENVTEAIPGKGENGLSYISVLFFVRKLAHLLNFYILGFFVLYDSVKN